MQLAQEKLMDDDFNIGDRVTFGEDSQVGEVVSISEDFICIEFFNKNGNLDFKHLKREQVFLIQD